jgi:hypothetical protein
MYDSMNSSSEISAYLDPLRRLPDRAEQRPCLTGVPRLPPGPEVVAHVEPVEPRALCLDGLVDQLAGRELLRGQLEPVAHQASTS